MKILSYITVLTVKEAGELRARSVKMSQNGKVILV